MTEDPPADRPDEDGAPSLPDILNAAADRAEAERGRAAAVEYVTVTTLPADDPLSDLLGQVDEAQRRLRAPDQQGGDDEH